MKGVGLHKKRAFMPIFPSIKKDMDLKDLTLSRPEKKNVKMH